jgi:uncharacterized protein (DUF58 family)
MSEHKETSTQALPSTLDRDFEIAVRRLAEDLRFGYDSSPYVGSGIDYVQSRPFVDGDSVKDIDWKLTARHNRFHVKEYESVKCTPIYLLVDTSASMMVHSVAFSKYTLAVLLAGGLGLAALRRLSPVGVLAAGDRDLHFQPSLSRGQLFQWLHALRQHQLDEQTRLVQRLAQLQQHLKSRSLIVVISDLHDPQAIRAIKNLAVQHDCTVLHLQDPSERGRLRGGIMRATEAESGRTFTARGKSHWFGAARHEAIAELKRAGIDYLLLATDQPFVAPLRRFLAERGGLMRNTR